MPEQSKQIMQEVSKAFMGKQEVVEKVLMTIYAGAMSFWRMPPGVGKTTLALALTFPLPGDFGTFTLENVRSPGALLQNGCNLNWLQPFLNTFCGQCWEHWPLC